MEFLRPLNLYTRLSHHHSKEQIEKDMEHERQLCFTMAAHVLQVQKSSITDSVNRFPKLAIQAKP